MDKMTKISQKHFRGRSCFYRTRGSVLVLVTTLVPNRRRNMMARSIEANMSHQVVIICMSLNIIPIPYVPFSMHWDNLSCYVRVWYKRMIMLSWRFCFCYFKINALSNIALIYVILELIFRVMALCAGNSPVTGEFPWQRPVARSFDVFFDLCLSKRFSKQSWGWWFGTPSRPLWRHYNAIWLQQSSLLVFIGINQVPRRY